MWHPFKRLLLEKYQTSYFHSTSSSTSTAKLDVVAKEAFKSPINPHIESRGQGGDLITCDAYICGIFEICKVQISKLPGRGVVGNNFDRFISYECEHK